MHYPYTSHHGAVTGVTGSCHELHVAADASYLIDCGLCQGANASSTGQAGRDALHIDFPLGTVRALIATHVHIDHVGRIPCLLATDLNGLILCSEPSAKLLPIVLEGKFKLGISRNQKKVERFIALVQQGIMAFPCSHWFALSDNAELVCRVRLQRAGHILGFADVESDRAGEKKRVVFSGGIGAAHAPLFPAPRAPYGAGILVIESTYGDRQHENRCTRRRLGRVIDQAHEDNGSELIPAFSIGRTQELLYQLEEIIHCVRTRSAEQGGRGRDGSAKAFDSEANWTELSINLDSPLASHFIAAYRERNQAALKRVEFGRRPLDFKQLFTVDSHSNPMPMVQHFSRTARPTILIAGDGICSSGRIFSYSKAMLRDKRRNVVCAGYQASGAPEQAIQTYSPVGGYFDLVGKRFNARAGIASVGGYSVHAGQNGLLKFVTGVRKPSLHIRIVHGEPKAEQVLAKRLNERYQSSRKPCILPSRSKAPVRAIAMETV